MSLFCCFRYPQLVIPMFFHQNNPFLVIVKLSKDGKQHNSLLLLCFVMRILHTFSKFIYGNLLFVIVLGCSFIFP